MKKTLICRADSYKYSHFLQYPKGIQNNNSYIESRGVAPDTTMLPQDAEVVFFGLQAFIKEYLSTPITLAAINKTERMITAHGEPFNRQGWIDILNNFGGYLPIEIVAVPEGTVMQPRNVMVQVRATHPDFAWLASFVETAVLRAVWYPSTVASVSREIKKTLKKFLDKTSDDPDHLNFMLHDFGARGTSSAESAAIGGLAHLVNFMGTDTVESLWLAEEAYNADGPVGFSIPASEHSTMTAWGKEHEADAYENMIDQYGGDGKIFSCVSDSYDIYNAVENIWGEALKDKVMKNGARLVVRPDSGPIDTPIKVIKLLMERFGYEINSKGYKVLPPYVRVIQGDGVNPTSIRTILSLMEQDGLAANNIAFGMGGALLQQINRDTLRFAMKTSAIKIDDKWIGVKKDPVTAFWKTSKQGLLKYENGKTLQAVNEHDLGDMKIVWSTGTLYEDYTFDQIRENAKI